jgi:hypothetical protein
VTGTLDCPAPSIFESGSTPVRGTIRNGEISVTLPGLTVSGTILNLGAQAVQLSGTSARRSAAFTGVVIGGNQIHARGVLDERPCNLNLARAARGAPVPERPVPERPVAAPPQRQPAPAQPAATSQGFDGPWSGTVNCPTRSLFDSGETQARGTIVNNTLTLSFGDVRVTNQPHRAGQYPHFALDTCGNRHLILGGSCDFGMRCCTTTRHADEVQTRVFEHLGLPDRIIGGQPVLVPIGAVDACTKGDMRRQYRLDSTHNR